MPHPYMLRTFRIIRLRGLCQTLQLARTNLPRSRRPPEQGSDGQFKQPTELLGDQQRLVVATLTRRLALAQ